MKNNERFQIDYSLISIVIILAIISIATLYTVSPFLPSKYDIYNFPFLQLRWYIIGSVAIIFIMLLDYDRFRKFTWILYGLGLIPLLMIYFKSYMPSDLIVEFNDIARAVKIPILGQLQPAEFFKIILTMTLAHIIYSHNEKYLNRTVKSDLGLLLKMALVALVPMGLIAIQPDLGSTLVLAFITGGLVLVSGIQWRVLFSLALAGVLGIVTLALLWLLSPGKIGEFLEESVFIHVKSRYYGWIYPEQYLDSGYQLILSRRAIGSGQLTGKGIQHIEVTDVPEQHTDMIFTAIAEQTGFIGVSILIIIFFLLIYRLINIAIKSNDQYGSYLVTGIIGMFTFQIFQNIGMSVQLLPITGIPLPFISYGGSSILTYMMGIGIALNVYSRTKTYMFD